jgi:glycerophosphoryl diester phosphodiesterase
MFGMLATLAALTVCVPKDATERMPEIIAHRGESSLAPENTLAAVNLAWKRDVKAVEIDVHQTADAGLVVCHDGDTKRTTDKNLEIAKSTVAELRMLKIKGMDGKLTDERIPLLSEVLATIPNDGRLFVEVKCGPQAVPLLKKEIAESHKRPQQVVVIAFDAKVIREVKRQLPEHQAYWLVGFKQDKKTKQWGPSVDSVVATGREAKADGIDIQSAEPLDAAYVKTLHDAGFSVYAWTVDSIEVARRLNASGVLGITTNRAGWMQTQFLRRACDD